MYAFVGIIMLVGIGKKNANMMIDFARRGVHSVSRWSAAWSCRSS